MERLLADLKYCLPISDPEYRGILMDIRHVVRELRHKADLLESYVECRANSLPNMDTRGTIVEDAGDLIARVHTLTVIGEAMRMRGTVAVPNSQWKYWDDPKE